MMPETIIESEADPAAYPATPEGLSEAASALDAAMLWQRIEAYIAHRFSERVVTWTVEGEGQWSFPLAPASLTSVEKWAGEAWEPAIVPLGPYGLCLPDDGPYRIFADVGSGPAPACVQEAFRRLAEYLAPDGRNGARTAPAGASSHEVRVLDVLEESYDRAPQWLARAMIYSGAADLLRPFRRAS
jgi:hypothetical protein